jgi:hypothetical protein
MRPAFVLKVLEDARIKAMRGRPNELNRSEEERPVVVNSILPFAFQNSTDEARIRSASIKLRQASLLHRSCTIPGTSILRHAYLRNAILHSNFPLLTAGILVPDRHAEADSFAELVPYVIQNSARRFTRQEQDDIRKSADLLDEGVQTPLLFTAHNTSEAFRNRLVGFLNYVRADNSFKAFEAEIDNAAAAIENKTTILPLSYVESIVKGRRNRFSILFRKYARFAYCQLGGEVLGADIILPDLLSFPDIDLRFSPSSVDPEGLALGTRRSDKMELHAALLRTVYLDARIFESIPCEKLLDLREITFVKQAMHKLTKLEDELRAGFERNGIPELDIVLEHKQIRTEAERLIRRELRREGVMRSADKYYDGANDVSTDVLDATLGVAVPFASTGRRIANFLAFSCFRKTVFAWSTTPIKTYLDYLGTTCT